MPILEYIVNDYTTSHSYDRFCEIRNEIVAFLMKPLTEQEINEISMYLYDIGIISNTEKDIKRKLLVANASMFSPTIYNTLYYSLEDEYCLAKKIS